MPIRTSLLSVTRDMELSETATFPVSLDSLQSVCEFVTHFAEEAGLDEETIRAMELAVDEACTNIVEYAYRDRQDGTIECTCTDRDNSLVISLRDQGRPFDPMSVPEPNLSANLAERRGGGLGIYLMRRLMDEIDFDFSESGNVLTMVKHKENKE